MKTFIISAALHQPQSNGFTSNSARDRQHSPVAGPGSAPAAPPRTRRGSVPSSPSARRTTSRRPPWRGRPGHLLGRRAAEPRGLCGAQPRASLTFFQRKLVLLLGREPVEGSASARLGRRLTCGGGQGSSAPGVWDQSGRVCVLPAASSPPLDGGAPLSVAPQAAGPGSDGPDGPDGSDGSASRGCWPTNGAAPL